MTPAAAVQNDLYEWPSPARWCTRFARRSAGTCAAGTRFIVCRRSGNPHLGSHGAATILNCYASPFSARMRASAARCGRIRSGLFAADWYGQLVADLADLTPHRYAPLIAPALERLT